MAARRFRLKYPPATAVALEDDMFVVGGGGGTSKSGIPNRVSWMRGGRGGSRGNGMSELACGLRRRMEAKFLLLKGHYMSTKICRCTN
eukprot:3270986-Rhodomonas_salina.1